MHPNALTIQAIILLERRQTDINNTNVFLQPWHLVLWPFHQKIFACLAATVVYISTDLVLIA